MRGNIFKEIIRPATTKIRCNDSKKRRVVTLDMMCRNIEKIASVTNPRYTGKVVLRKGDNHAVETS